MALVRQEDISDFDNLANRFIAGRKVGKIPTGSADIEATDRVGDVSFAANGAFIYYFVDVSGTPAWRRIALVSW